MTQALLRALLLASLLSPLAPARQESLAPEAAAPESDPISAALTAASEDVREYNDHLVTLSSPYLEGRLPGTRGMELASEYVEHWFKHHGLAAPFENGTSYRQPFPLADRSTLVSQSFAAQGPGQATAALVAGTDYTALSSGASGKVTARAVFVGYSIAEGEDGYTNYPAGLDLTGKIAVMFRFEPMESDGTSRWSGRGWSDAASFNRKLSAAQKAGAAGAVIINPPGAADPRAERLSSFNGGGGRALEGPVFLLSREAGAALLEAADPKHRSAAELRDLADNAGTPVELDVTLALEVEIDAKTVTAENVGGLIQGRGELADELIVIGAHLDHLGLGSFGSRADRSLQGNTIHPGADDNASGVAALILLADRITDDFAALPADAPARSVLLLAFSAEESGLNGSQYYVEHPIAPMEEHALMINFDMIGRIVSRRLSVFGTSTGNGLAEWAQPFFDGSELAIQASPEVMSASDHASFVRKECPVLFAITADLSKHADYHTPGDTSDKINRIDAVRTVDLFHELAVAAATRPERFEFQAPPRRGGATAEGSFARPRVRFGIEPAMGEGEGLGVAVANVTPGGAAEEAGVKAGDILVRWNGVKVPDLRSWMETLSAHNPGDKVTVGVKRGGEELTLEVTLKGQ